MLLGWPAKTRAMSASLPPAQSVPVTSVSHLVLSDIEPKEVEACLPLHFFQRMGDAGLTGFQFEPERFEPLSRYWILPHILYLR
jgi:hypothetical protein